MQNPWRPSGEGYRTQLQLLRHKLSAKTSKERNGGRDEPPPRVAGRGKRLSSSDSDGGQDRSETVKRFVSYILNELGFNFCSDEPAVVLGGPPIGPPLEFGSIDDSAAPSASVNGVLPLSSIRSEESAQAEDAFPNQPVDEFGSVVASHTSAGDALSEHDVLVEEASLVRVLPLLNHW